MSITFQCGQCGKTLKLAAAMAGRKGKCPQCQAALRVPAEGGPMKEPAKPTPSTRIESSADADSPLDWGLIEQAMTEEPQPEPGKKKVAAGEVDWDALARGESGDIARSAPVPRRSSGAMPNWSAVERRAPKDGKGPDTTGAFLTGAFMSIPKGVGYIPAAIMLILFTLIALLVLGVILWFMGAWAQSAETSWSSSWSMPVGALLTVTMGFEKWSTRRQPMQE